MSQPDFILIGVTKGGSTSIYHYLRQHPDVFMPSLKEPRFFLDIKEEDQTNKKIKSIGEYKNLFSDAPSASVCGEATSGYFSSDVAPRAIKNTLDNPLFILVLRNPVERAFSHFTYAKQKSLEPNKASFESAIRDNKIKVRGKMRNRKYVESGFYYKHLMKWYSYFDEEKFLILLFDDLVSSPNEFVRKVYKFIGVGSEFTPEFKHKYAKSGVPKSNLIHNILRGTNKLRDGLKYILHESIVKGMKDIKLSLKNWNLRKPKMKKSTYIKLANVYKKDIKKLEKEIDKDLSRWINHK